MVKRIGSPVWTTLSAAAWSATSAAGNTRPCFRFLVASEWSATARWPAESPSSERTTSSVIADRSYRWTPWCSWSSWSPCYLEDQDGQEGQEGQGYMSYYSLNPVVANSSR